MGTFMGADVEKRTTLSSRNYSSTPCSGSRGFFSPAGRAIIRGEIGRHKRASVSTVSAVQSYRSMIYNLVNVYTVYLKWTQKRPSIYTDFHTRICITGSRRKCKTLSFKYISMLTARVSAVPKIKISPVSATPSATSPPLFPRVLQLREEKRRAS